MLGPVKPSKSNPLKPKPPNPNLGSPPITPNPNSIPKITPKSPKHPKRPQHGVPQHFDGLCISYATGAGFLTF